ncbi:MAG: heme-binding protein [Isosphaeraceae bacterium]|nr:heme-binding protein [Isosphaeraceae bacterium]
MRHRLKRRIAAFSCASVIILVFASRPAQELCAQTAGAPLVRIASDVRDEAGLFSRDAVAAARKRLAQIEATYHVPAVIETIDSLGGSALEAAAVDRARKTGVEGVFILVAKRETKIDAIRSARFATVVEAAQLHAIRDAFIAEFGKRDFDDGLTKGVAEIEKALAEAKARGRVAPAPSPSSSLVLRNQVRLTLDGARKIVAGAQAKAQELNLKINIAVVDDGGHMIAFERMDGARPASGYTATTKAVTAATFRQATGPLPAGTTAPDLLLNLSLQNAAAASGGKVTTLLGGVPVVVDGQVIAGVGVGGGTGEQDATVARAGIASFLAEVEGKTSQ